MSDVSTPTDTPTPSSPSKPALQPSMQPQSAFLWSIRGLKGVKEEVLEQISAMKDIPEEDLVWLKAKVLKIHGRAVKVDCHATLHGKDPVYTAHFSVLF